jgi:hypothetical protein
MRVVQRVALVVMAILLMTSSFPQNSAMAAGVADSKLMICIGSSGVSAEFSKILAMAKIFFFTRSWRAKRSSSYVFNLGFKADYIPNTFVHTDLSSLLTVLQAFKNSAQAATIPNTTCSAATLDKNYGLCEGELNADPNVCGVKCQAALEVSTSHNAFHFCCIFGG